MREPFWDEDAAPFLHGGTYAGHPGACVAALANLDIIERERLVERVAALEPVLAELARAARATPPASPRSGRAGLAGAIELDADLPRASIRQPGAAVVEAARRSGVITRLLRGVALQISPPLVVTETELERSQAPSRRRFARLSARTPRETPDAIGSPL